MSTETHESTLANNENLAKPFYSLPDFDFSSCCSDMDFNTIDDSTPNALASQYVEIQTKIKELEKKAAGIRHELIKLAQGDKTICGSVQIIKCVKKGAIDNEQLYAHFEIASGMSIEQYRKKPTEYWTVRPLEPSLPS